MGTPRIKALTEKQISEMIELKKAGKSLTEIAEIYHVTVATVNIRTRDPLRLREKRISLYSCSKCIDDCLNCKKPDCDYNGRVQPHEKINHVNALTVDMFIDMLKIN